jgi:hypothetical protein
MVSEKELEKQLKRLGINTRNWGRSEYAELPNILLPNEEIYECVNGIYEGGFALLVATDVRVLLIDKKPLNYLTVEDMRFDMISEMDYNHRLFGAFVLISSGTKNLTFRSYNQQRLRKLINHVQHCMAETKKKQSSHAEGQSQHLERINEQLQVYLRAQQEYQQQLNQQGGQAKDDKLPVPPKPGNELADYLYAQSLMQQHFQQAEPAQSAPGYPGHPEPQQAGPATAPVAAIPAVTDDDLYDAARQEIFGKQAAAPPQVDTTGQPAQPQTTATNLPQDLNNPLRIAYAKLPMALRNRRFGRPSFHAHSQAAQQTLFPTYSR